MKILLVTVAVCLAACAPKINPTEQVEENSTPENNRVLIIGDSISFGYMPALESFRPELEFTHTISNSKNSTFTRKNLDAWLASYEEPFGTIIWNNGMWNTIHGVSPEPGHPPAEPLENLFSSLETYEYDLREIAAKLKATGSRIVFVTTTFIPDPQRGILEMGYERELNAVAKRVLPEFGIEILDLYPVSESLPSSMRMYGYDIHYTDEGSSELAKFLAEGL